MNLRSESRIAIAGSAPEVWDYLADVGRWPEWAPTVREAWIVGGGPLQPGSRVEQRAKLPFGATRHRAQNVTAVGAPRSMAFAAGDFLHDVQRPTLGLVVQPADIFAHERKDEHLDGAEHDHH